MIIPDWPVSSRVRAISTTRQGGVSLPPYQSFNLAEHVGDHPSAVAENRRLLRTHYQLPSEPVWLRQVHGCVCYTCTHSSVDLPTPEADASMTRHIGQVLAVMTADCLPILLTNRAETLVMAVHAGWRGLAQGIIAQTIAQSGERPDQLLAWIGPGIGGQVFEVGEDVRHAFLARETASVEDFSSLGVSAQSEAKYLLDTVNVAKAQLQALGVGWIGGGHWCTYQNSERFFSYRRDGVTGRMASLIWLDA